MKTMILLSALLSIPAFARDGGGSSVGTGNPAAKFCLDLGGQLERTSDARGEDADCVIDEWKLFREMSKAGLVKDINIGPGGANPAAINCDNVGGKWRVVNTPEGEEGMCAVEQWDLFRLFHK